MEVLIRDNASADDSVEQFHHRYAGEERVRVMAADANYGVAGGRNRAFREARGDLLFSLDSDAVLATPGALQHLAEAFRRDPQLGAVSFEVKRPDEHLMWPFSRPAATWRHRSFLTMRVDGCAFAVPRTAFERVGGFAEHFSPYGAEDQHFAFSLLGRGYHVLYDPGIVVIHAFSPQGRNATQFQMHVRNLLWIPLELFPMPAAALSVLRLSASLFRDAVEQKRIPYFFRGVADALRGFRRSRRSPMSREGWLSFRALVKEDKRLAREG
jgi:GT2 family glycosyltransferase